MSSPQPLIVALYGGPGCGKSTTAAVVFGRLKHQGINVELVTEYAKDLTWEGRDFALSHQPYLMAKQIRNYDRLTGKVDVIITDTSPLLSIVYPSDTMEPLVRSLFHGWVAADWKSRNTLNVFLHRDPSIPYVPEGRSQSEGEAKYLDGRISEVLQRCVTGPLGVQVDREANSHIDLIVARVLEEMSA